MARRVVWEVEQVVVIDPQTETGFELGPRESATGGTEVLQLLIKANEDFRNRVLPGLIDSETQAVVPLFGILRPKIQMV